MISSGVCFFLGILSSFQFRTQMTFGFAQKEQPKEKPHSVIHEHALSGACAALRLGEA